MTAPAQDLGDKRLLHRIIRSRPHLMLAVLFGVVVALAWPAHFSGLRRALVGWNAGVWAYLVSMTWMMARAAASSVASTGMSLYAIVSELTRMDHLPADQVALRYAFTAITVIGSWLLVGVLFCIHYAHLYYRAGNSEPPLRFPQDGLEPDYWDFLYFSFTIAVAVQTSDVAVASRSMRKLVLGHSVLAFFFNLLILGLSVNIAAGLINT
jgi:uncharacterized membrane protein